MASHSAALGKANHDTFVDSQTIQAPIHAALPVS